MLAFTLFAGLAAAIASTNDYPPTPLSTACGDIVNDNLYNGSIWFYASDAIACMTSVPFNPAVATRFVKYYNQTLQFQSTSAFVRNPPSGYQQPPFDIQAALSDVQNRINTGYYRNQYAFEADIQRISLNIHDSHAYVFAGIFQQFSFSIPYYLYAASDDSKSIPKIYVSGNDSTPIATFNGLPAVQWLEQYAANQSFGFVEANAAWNQLMVSPAQLIIGATNPLTGGGTFYAGDELDVVYADGTEETWPWYALYNSPGFTGPLETGGDFYNFFVLGLAPANYDDTFAAYEASQNITDTDDDDDTNFYTCENYTSWGYVSDAYPNNTMTHQSCLGLFSSGVITSYFFNDISTAVISIPSFVEAAETTGDFSNAVNDFINNATSRGAKKVIIDLQQNGGGQVGLAYETFGLFFPDALPFGGSRMRAHPLMNDFGTTLTGYFQTLGIDDPDYPIFVGDEFVVTDRINAATGDNFTSWQQFYGPVRSQGDTFSLVEQYNLSNAYFLNYALGDPFFPCYYGAECRNGVAFQPEDITLLTDGTCASTCALFVELMSERGVHSVAVGGLPQNGPMQTASGSRGAVAYSGTLLDDDATLTQVLNASAATAYNNDTGMVVSLAGITLRDQIRENGVTPLQFLYLPADCRIFWTLKNVNNYTQLWHDTYNAVFGDTSVCVSQSVNAQPPAAVNKTISLPQVPSEGGQSPVQHIFNGINPSTQEAVDGNAGRFVFCDNGGNKAVPSLCSGGKGTCTKIQVPCGGTDDLAKGVSRFVCLPTCRQSDSTSSGCPTFGVCSLSANKTPNSGRNAVSSSSHQPRVQINGGTCRPNPESDATQCSRISGTKTGPVPLAD